MHKNILKPTMNRKTFIFFLTILCMTCATFAAQATVANDTIEFTTTQVEAEPDYNAEEFVFTIYSNDGNWKIQLDYHAEDMYGTFRSDTTGGHRDEFRLAKGGRNYNYVRNPNNSMMFYSFDEIALTVTVQAGATIIELNALAGNGTRFIVHASIPATVIADTIHSDFGNVAIDKVSLGNYFLITAQNADYDMQLGIVADTLRGTFYVADILQPEISERATGQSIEMKDALIVATTSNDTIYLDANFISTSDVLYHFTMYNAYEAIVPTDTVRLDFGRSGTIEDHRNPYDCYQFVAYNDQYAVGIAIQSDVLDSLESDYMEWEKKDFNMYYTRLVTLPDNTSLRINDITGNMHIVKGILEAHADIICTNHTLYQISMEIELPGYVPDAIDTVDIDFGDNVTLIDYTKGLGTVGVGAAKQGEYQMRLYVQSYVLSGTFTADDILLDASDITIINDTSITFYDAWTASAQMDSMSDGSTRIYVEMMAHDSIYYRMRMRMAPKKYLADTTLAISAASGTTMVTVYEGAQDNIKGYTLHFINVDDNTDEGYELAFFFIQEGWDGIKGSFSIDDDNLDASTYHSFYEDGAEIRVAPFVERINIDAEEKVTLIYNGKQYPSHFYSVDFKFVGHNGYLYQGEGRNYMVCIDHNYLPIVLTEQEVTDLLEHPEVPLKVKKIYKNGQVVICTDDHQYDVSGRTIK